MAQWAALRHARGLDSQKKCDNCGKPIAQSHKYCFWCAIFGGRRKLKNAPFKIDGHVPQGGGTKDGRNP